jgi:hypothetical protein
MSAGTPVQVRLPDDELDALDSYRRTQKSPPSRAQAARELMRHALNERMSDGSNAAEHHGVAA